MNQRLEELGQHELLERLHQTTAPVAIFVYTSLCGTCQLAERMLEIVVATGVKTPIYKININYASVLVDKWKITSVPCLVMIQEGRTIQTEYAMQSVDHLYTLIKRLEDSKLWKNPK